MAQGVRFSGVCLDVDAPIDLHDTVGYYDHGWMVCKLQIYFSFPHKCRTKLALAVMAKCASLCWSSPATYLLPSSAPDMLI